MPVLWRNTLAGLSDSAGELYLRGAARNELAAFRMACTWQEILEPALAPMFAKTIEIGVEAGLPSRVGAFGELMAFTKERHYRKTFPDGRSA